MIEKRDRSAQKSRTREALLQAARDILVTGGTVTVTAAADRAQVSKATAYRYFSDPAILVAEAGLDFVVLRYEEIVKDAVTTRDRVLAVSLYYLDLAIDRESEFRQFIGLTLGDWRSEEVGAPTRRGARRIPMFERALSGAGLSKDREAALVRALATATGAEAMIALFDVVGADRDTARATVLDIAEALLDRYLGPKF